MMPVNTLRTAVVVRWIVLVFVASARVPILTAAHDLPDGDQAVRRYVYTARGPVGKLGSVSVSLRNGTMRNHAAALPYLVGMPEMRAFRLNHLDTPLLIAKAKIESGILPSYHLEAYCKPESLFPVRAVRWKNEVPDVVMDFARPGEIFVTKAKERKAGLAARIIGVSGEPSYHVKTRPEPVPVSSDVTDLLTAFLRFKEAFAETGETVKPRYFFAIKKGDTSMYAIRFVPGKIKPMRWRVNGKTATRQVREFSCELSYAVSFQLTPEMTLADIRKRFLPKFDEEGFEDHLNEMVGGDWQACRNKTLTIPVSGEVYNRFHGKTDPFEGPFGLAEQAIVWIDTQTGLPVLFDGKTYGFSAVVQLETVADEDWAP